VELSIPPRIKFLEALGSVADGRVQVISDREASVRASEGERFYRVYVDLEGGVVDSDDNGTTYRNYIGYPILAFLMVKGVLPYDSKLGEALKGIKWHSLNERYKSYRLVESYIKKMLADKGVDSREVDALIGKASVMLSELRLRKR
jgi:hypothetical protein